MSPNFGHISLYATRSLALPGNQVAISEVSVPPEVTRKLTFVRVLLTAFEPYDHWTSNSSWMALVELLKDFPSPGILVTRRYPVNLTGLKEKLSQDLKRPYDAIIHLGQSPGASGIKLEAIALNAAGCVEERGDELTEIIPDGPVAYRSNMPLARWVSILRKDNIPSSISYHAGTYLCNAAMYLTHHYLHSNGPNERNCQVGFVHLPLATEQVAHQSQSLPSLPVNVLARAIRLLVEDILQSDKAVSNSEQVA